MSGHNLLITALAALREETGRIHRRWLRDGVANVDRLGDTDESPVDGVPDPMLDNATTCEQDRILSFLIAATLDIQYNLDEIEGIQRLLEVGSEARAVVRHHYGADSAAQHALEAHRPTFFVGPGYSKIGKFAEVHNICTKRQIVDDLSKRLHEDPNEVLNNTAKLQNPEPLVRFENLPVDIGPDDRIENFLRSAQLLTLIGNVVDLRLEDGVETTIDYYANIRVDNHAQLTR